MNTSQASKEHLKPNRLSSSIYSCLAIALVFNSHLEEFYPYTWLAGDGLLGNSMFFFLSGWGIAVSWDSTKRSFTEYCLRRLQRIYPSLILAVFVLHWLPKTLWKTLNIWENLELFVYPTSFTYIKEIIPGYLILFLLLSSNWIRFWKPIVLALSATYFGWYVAMFDLVVNSPSLGLVPEPFHSLYYAAVMIAGAAHGKRYFPSLGPFWFAMFTVVLYLLAKFGITFFRGGWLFPVLHLLCFVAVCLSFFQMDRIANTINPNKLAANVMLFIAAMTLEIYVVHSMLIELNWIQRWQLSAVVSIPLLAVFTLVIACFFQRICSKVRFV